MKVARCTDGDVDSSFWGIVDDTARTVTPIEIDFSTWAPLLTSDPGSPLPTGSPRDLDELRLLAPVPDGANIVAAGATYPKHVAGLGLQMPEQPAAFIKTMASLIGPDDRIRYPEITEKLDYEGELVAVVGATDVDRHDPMSSILGYTVGNDVSARDLQFSGGVTGMDMFSAKVLEATSGIGPWIVTRDEFGNAHPDLELELTVDGQRRQHDRTSSMVWGADELVGYVNSRLRLHAGDALFTGTCAGVGHEDGRYLEPGQVVVVSIERIGSLENVVGERRRESSS
jgi:2-keto-4-pentenoate hydratase/2-oxohepta-3-ene-1,7-dioic acid hydratase in catechol pathway